MSENNGSVSINTENIFPIIKKWLYSEKDIFIREIISNAGDAISKLIKLVNLGEAQVEDDPAWKIEVIYDSEAGTLTVSDNGIGMTAEEVDKYINQIAFSGAKDFIEKYEGKADADQIIGHFGLGFYSTFMVSDKVEIDTRSFVPGSASVHWESDDGISYKTSESLLEDRGTYVTMHLSEDAKEFREKSKLTEVLEKYFSFFPYEIYLTDAKDVTSGDEEETVVSGETEPGEKTADGEADGDKKAGGKAGKPAPKPINDTAPLWLKNAKDCTDEEYKAFYRKTFADYEDPLFWIHLNVDYPFNLKGILYFPKLKDRYERFEGQIKVYYNRVFVADNIKEILPEFLMLLKGVIDCPDLPLNVSRSFLQNDGYVNKISAHITKKVADKLNGLFNTEREDYCRYWDDINPFVKYGCLKDEKLFDKIKGSIVYKTTDGEYLTKDEYFEKTKDAADGKTVFYTDDPVIQAQYVKMLNDKGIPVAVMETVIDSPFMQFMEYKSGDGVKFSRVDSDVTSTLKDKDSGEQSDAANDENAAKGLENVFRIVSGNPKLKVKAEKLSVSIPAIIILSEQARRFSDMMKQFGSPGSAFGSGEDITLCLNTGSPAITKLYELAEAEGVLGTPEGNDADTGDAAKNGDAAKTEDAGGSEDAEKAGASGEAKPLCDKVALMARQIYNLASLAHKPLDAERMNEFIADSAKIIENAF